MPTDKAITAAKELLKTVGVSSAAVIEEIPLCWNNQVGIRFTLGEWHEKTNDTLFALYAGASKDNPEKFFIELYVENDRKFPFYIIHDVYSLDCVNSVDTFCSHLCSAVYFARYCVIYD